MASENRVQLGAESTANDLEIHDEETMNLSRERTEVDVEFTENPAPRISILEGAQRRANRSLNEVVFEAPPGSSRMSQHLPIVGSLVTLTDEQVTSGLEGIVVEKRVVDARLLLYLCELDRRRLYRERGYSSLFDFCVSHLRFSEDVAYKRVSAARMIREYPLALELLCDGKIHLSALVILKPHLTSENYREWFAAAVGKSKREIERIVAGRYPQPDVASRVRKLPEVVTCTEPMQLDSRNHVDSTDSEGGGSFGSKNTVAAPSVTIPSRRTVLQPISAQKYRVAFTVSVEFKRKLEQAKALVSHSISPADLPALFERALDVLIESTERRRFGSKQSRPVDTSIDSIVPEKGSESCADSRVVLSTAETIGESARKTQRIRRTVTGEKQVNRGTESFETEPRDSSARDSSARDSSTRDSSTRDSSTRDSSTRDSSTRDSSARDSSARDSYKSRYIPVNVRREVWQRDEGQCTFVSEEGRRCTTRHFLQIDHVTPFALGGGSSATNLRLRCAAHNTMHAERCFGRERIAMAVVRARICRNE